MYLTLGKAWIGMWIWNLGSVTMATKYSPMNLAINWIARYFFGTLSRLALKAGFKTRPKSKFTVPLFRIVIDKVNGLIFSLSSFYRVVSYYYFRPPLFLSDFWADVRVFLRSVHKIATHSKSGVLGVSRWGNSWPWSVTFQCGQWGKPFSIDQQHFLTLVIQWFLILRFRTPNPILLVCRASV
jgi:hypothetical protein